MPMNAPERWPSLPLEEWGDTYETLHRWTQIVGKVRTACTPWINHSWHTTLYLTARGLTTSPIPYGDRTFTIDFDFLNHRLEIESSDGGQRELALRPEAVADFHDRLFAALGDLDLSVAIHGRPNEVEDATPFREDRAHSAYDPDYANRLWRILSSTERVFTEFRAEFIGKNSPVHFFWGAFDLAVSRFSGRAAPPHPGGVPNLPDWIAREAYSREVASVGFWPGGGAHLFPFFYAYVYPEPDGYPAREVSPSEAFYSTEMREFVLPYDAVRQAESPEARVREFLQSTYDAAAELGDWDRASLERDLDPRRSANSPSAS
ncbi:MAG: hypothetical protein GEU90_09005 [Gemmatimonas sp.]|nr:hypothetical protein [Gemmatimonas sp.]